MIDTDKIRRNINNGFDPYTSRDIVTLCDEIDRLRGVQTPQGKTVDVRVAIVVSQDGGWWAQGEHDRDMQPEDMLTFFEPGDAKYWLTATLPVPQEVEVVAKVEDE